MSKVGEIINRKTFTHEIDGIEFVMWRLSAKMALRVLGSKLFGMVAAARTASDKQGVAEKIDLKKQREIMEKYLRDAMISPACGDVTDADADIITFDDLDRAGMTDELFRALMSSAEGGDTGFTETFSAGQTADESQAGSTDSDSDTEGGQAS